MADFALYVFVVLCGSAGLLGHTPILPRLACSALAWRANRGPRGSRVAPTPLRPTESRTRPSWAQPDEEAA